MPSENFFCLIGGGKKKNVQHCKKVGEGSSRQGDLELSYSSYIPLQNNSVPGKGHENMCFANSAVQVLFSLSNFVQHVLENLPSPSTYVVSKIKELLMDMCSSHSVNTFKYVSHLSLPGYTPYEMFDSQEFLVHILNSLYPTLDQDCMFKIGMLSSISCHGSSCRHSIDTVESLHHLSLSLDPNKFSFSIRELLLNYQLTEEMNDYRCEGCAQQGTCIREMTISDTSDVIILQVKAFQIINGTVFKNNSKVLLDSELNDFYGKKYSLHGVIYHIGTSAYSGHYICKIRRDDQSWLSIDDSKAYCTSKLSVRESNATPYIVFYKKVEDISGAFLANQLPPHSQLSTFSNIGTSSFCASRKVNSVSDLSKGNQNLINELKFQALRVEKGKKEQKINLIENFKGKRKVRNKTVSERQKSYQINATPEKTQFDREKDRQRKTDARNNATPEKTQLNREKDRKRKAEACINATPEKTQLERDNNRKRMANARANTTSENRQLNREKDRKRKAEACINETPEKTQLERDNNRKRMANARANTTSEKRQLEKDLDKKRKSIKSKEVKNGEMKAFEELDSKADLSILDSKAFKVIKKKCDEAFSQGAEYICDVCDQLCFKRNTKKLNSDNYVKDDNQKQLFQAICRNISKHICLSCHSKIARSEFPPNAIGNVGLDEPVEVLSCLNDIEHSFISQIIPFMSITARHRGAQKGLKGQVVLVPTDVKKIQQLLPRSSYKGNLVTVSIKRRLSDLSAYIKQNIRPDKINLAFQWLKKNNPLYKNVQYDPDWEQSLQSEDPELWNLMTSNDPNPAPQKDEVIDSDTDDEGVNNKKEQTHKSGIPRPSLLHDIHGPEVSMEKIIEVAPGEGQIPVNATVEPDYEALAFPKLFPRGRYHYNWEGRPKKLRSSLAYYQCRLKSSDPRFACDNRYSFMAMDIVDRDAIHKAITFSHQKAKNSDLSVGQLRNPRIVKKMMSDQEIYSSFKKIRGTPQYFKDMLHDVLAKVRYYGVYTFFMTWSAAQFHWKHLIKFVGRVTIPRKSYTDDEIEAMDWVSKANILKRHPVLVARQIDYIFQTVWNKCVLSGLHPLGEILNYDQRAEYQTNTGCRHIHTPIHVKDAPKIDENTDEEVVSFIDQHITCEVPDEERYPDFHKLITKVQAHSHTQTCKKKKGVFC